jgi:hypothetical protein
MKKQNFTSKLTLLCFFVSVIGNLIAGNRNEMQINPDLRFIENKGQVGDQHNNTRPDVRYYGSSNGMNFHLNQKGISYQLSRVDTWKTQMSSDQRKLTGSEEEKMPDQLTLYRVDIEWVNSNPYSVIETGEVYPGHNNFYTSVCPKGVTDVRSFKEIKYRNIYEGINLRWYSGSDGLEYDFELAPGADYHQIEISVKGATNFRITENGELEISTPLGKIIEKSPVVTQGAKVIPAKWKLNGNNLAFELEAFNSQLPLTIDPVVRAWGTFYGGSAWEFRYSSSDIPIDIYGNVYLCGTTGSTNAIATTGAYQTTIGGNFDAVLSQFSSAGVLNWGTYYGGDGNDYCNASALDNLGHVYLTGFTNSTSGIASSGGHQTTNAGGFDAFLAQFTVFGTLNWGTYYGGLGYEQGVLCTGSSDGTVYLCGYSNSNTAIATSGSFQDTYSGGQDAFLVKFDASGNRVWGTYYGGSGDDYGLVCSIYGTNSIVFAGSTSSTSGIATTGAYQTSFAGGPVDAFITVFDNSGALNWGTYYGGTGEDWAGQNIFMNFAKIYIPGYTTSTNGISTSNAYQVSNAGGWDAYFGVFDLTSGNFEYGTYFGGSATDYGYTIATSGSYYNNQIFMSGFTESSSGIATPDAFQTTLGGGRDAFLADFKIGTSPGLNWATYYGGSGYDYGLACPYDGNGNVYLMGHSESTSGIASAGAYQETNGGGYDLFLTKFYYDCLGGDSTYVSASSCDSYTLNNYTYYSTGIYYQNLVNTYGCDSVVILDLVINYSSVPTDIYSTGYGNVTINNVVYTSSGLYTQTLTNVVGCDSLLNLYVTILTPISAGSDKIICSGTQTYMTADLPSGYTGTWTKIAGAGIVTTPTSPTSQVKNFGSGSSGTFLWTATNGILTSLDTVVVRRADVPTGLSVSSVGPTSVTFTWTASVDPDSFWVRITENCAVSGGFNFRVSGNLRSYTFSGLNGCTNYCIKLRTQCSGPVYSTFTQPVSFTTSGPVPCVAVKGFTMAQSQNCTYTCSWANSCVGADSFRVRYKLSSSSTWSFSSWTTGTSAAVNLGPGVWNVRVQSKCGSTLYTSLTTNYTISSCRLGVNNTETSSNLILFPNPASERANLNFTSLDEGNYTITVKDISGRTLRTISGFAVIGENTAEINVTGLSKGMYLLGLNLNGETRQVKLTVE